MNKGLTITGTNYNMTTVTEITGTNQLYSSPELIDTIVLPDCIKLVYKRQYMVANNWGLPNPEIYVEVYSRTDGSVRIEQGRYIPSQSESYELP